MEELPKIELEAYVIPAVEEKIFDQMWVTDFVVRADNALASNLCATLRPMCSKNGEVLFKSGTEKSVELQDLFSILNGTKIEPKLTPETIIKGGQLMALTLDFLKSVVIDKMQPNPVIEEPTQPVKNVDNTPITTDESIVQ